MIFLYTQEDKLIDTYISYLQAIGAFSNLFSSSNKPFIQYRVAENLFCKAFEAENLARADVAYDAVINGFGIGIKTFILSGASKIEKVAEFNSLSSELRALRGIDLAHRLADYRNERIEFANRVYNIEKGVYHIVGRDENVIKLFEVTYDLIDKDTIEIIDDSKSSLKFRDTYNEYNFNHSKSVLMKRFNVPKDCIEIPVETIEDPIEQLLGLTGIQTKTADDIVINEKDYSEIEELVPGKDYVILPLYSPKAKEKNKEPIVPLKNQLNLWNGGGRKRDPGEVCILIPKMIHKLAPGFLPKRAVVFNLKIPSGEVLSAKVCEDGDKALKTNPNNAMVDWILRKVLKLAEGELLTYDKLKKVGYDSVKITKLTDDEYLIDFAQLDSYETFIDLIKL